MERDLYEIKYTNWSIFRIYCANKKEKEEYLKRCNELQNKWLVETMHYLISGIHTTKNFLKMTEKYIK